MAMPVKFDPTEIQDVRIVEVGRVGDDRGFFSETYSQAAWAEQGFEEMFVQDNLSLSARGTLRGMHYQVNPHAMGKYVRAVTGAIFDVAVDLRRGSPTFGQWAGRELSEANGLAIWVPPGFAHGFMALADHTLVYYKTTHLYTPDAERILSYRCPRVGIEWPIEPTVVSPKDGAAPGLEEADFNFEYTS
jgi:dTDP-4-dehydrorhamnose 3,5-epimerase